MFTLCGIDCCEQCPMLGNGCLGCEATNGHPCGGSCIAADKVREKGFDAFAALKAALIAEINALGIEGLKVSDLNLLNGAFVNLEYTLPGGQSVKFLDDRRVYFGNQIELPGTARCLGVVADESFLLVCEYGCGGTNPELLLFKYR